ncbi:MAG: hypothetical protein J07HN6_01755 [Halonotius sp. J07HN6]|nr:MAG: hypothetical protein J07HN6_01755 [Halonotius sp. J07HN6]
MSEWRDMIVGDRMTVDQAFSERVQQSQFSNQEWGLIMTATEFEFVDADDPETARIVADTNAVESIIPELENLNTGAGPMAGATESSGGEGGIIDAITGALGLDSDDDGIDEETLAAAESLTQAYAEELQAHLEAENKFEAVRQAAAEVAT